VITTHALFAREVQRKLSNGIAALPLADHRLIERDRGHDGQRLRRAFAEDPGRTQPEQRTPALQLKREWSPWPEIRASFQRYNFR
jgi:hypothetical protein